MTIEVLNTGCDAGAEIAGADLTKPLASHDVARIEQAFLDHQVLLFRGQELSAQAFVDFSAQFGPLRRHIQKAFRHPTVPEIVYNRNVDDDGNFDEAGARRGVTNTLAEGWHSDGSYDESPPKATTVHALELPSSGGNTCFASTYRAFETLPPAFRDRVMNMKAEFALGRNKRNQQTQILTRKLTAEDKEQPTVIHPVICRHPETKRPAIFANPLLTVRVLDVDEAESDEILEELFDHINQAGTTGAHWEHEWRIGDTLMWDNRGGLVHSGRLDYPLNERRIMYRGTVGSSAIEAMSEAA